MFEACLECKREVVKGPGEPVKLIVAWRRGGAYSLAAYLDGREVVRDEVVVEPGEKRTYVFSAPRQPGTYRVRVVAKPKPPAIPVAPLALLGLGAVVALGALAWLKK